MSCDEQMLLILEYYEEFEISITNEYFVYIASKS